jgi:hypothetical protein
MQHSVEAFVAGILDYAGIFPPAKLPLSEAVRLFQSYKRHPHSTMVPRFVIPAPKLSELSPLLEPLLSAQSDSKENWHLSVLLQQSASFEEAALLAKQDVQSIQAFLDRQRGFHIAIDSLEWALPSDLQNKGCDEIQQSLLNFHKEIFESKSSKWGSLFVEVSWKLPFEESFKALSELHKKGHAVAAKIRTGGLTPDAVPPPLKLAQMLWTLGELKLPFKATAGLHQPLRHKETAADLTLFGFLNVFAAACALYCREVDIAWLQKILLLETIDAFRFTESGLHIDDLFLTTEEILRARHNFALSFGSCSFEEPIQYLKEFKLINE